MAISAVTETRFFFAAARQGKESRCCSIKGKATRLCSHVLAVARRVEAILDAIAFAVDLAEVSDLRRRALEIISELPSAVDRARLTERIDDAVAARLQELG